MARNTVGDWSETAGNNTDVGGIDIDEGCAAANVNNALREMMAQIATFSIGDLSVNSLTSTEDIEANGVPIGQGTGGGSSSLVFGSATSNTGIQNIAIGSSSLRDTTTGRQNTGLGVSALRDNITGDENVALGTGALANSETGDNNIAVGTNSAGALSPFQVTTQSDRIVMGNNDHTNAYIKIAWTVTSDERDKTAFAPVPHGLDFVAALEPTEYQFKAGGRDGEADGIKRYGFTAQQVSGLEGDDPVIVDDEDAENLKLRESYLIPVLVNAIKELKERLDALEA